MNEIKWEGNVQNEVDMPWLDWIESGKKTVECRMKRGKWAKMKEGDILILSDGKKIVETVIVGVKSFHDFQLAFDFYGKQMVPKDLSRDEVGIAYDAIYPETDKFESGDNIVAISIHVINSKKS